MSTECEVNVLKCSAERRHWVAWVMGRRFDGSRGSKVTSTDPLSSLVSLSTEFRVDLDRLLSASNIAMLNSHALHSVCSIERILSKHISIVISYKLSLFSLSLR